MLKITNRTQKMNKKSKKQFQNQTMQYKMTLQTNFFKKNSKFGRLNL